MRTLIAILLHARPHLPSRSLADRERGNVTMEHVIWAVALIAIVGIAVAAITTFVTGQSALITPGG